MAREVMRRQDLERPYRRPYVVALGETVRDPAYAGAVAKLAIVPGLLLGLVALVDPSSAVPVAGVAVVFVLCCALLLLTGTAWTVFRITRQWDARGELEQVRRGRPHLGDADPVVAHDEFAVTVEDDGWLAVWRLRPLAIDETPAGDEVLVLGRPCHAGAVVERLPFDPQDAARAAEQLAEAQAVAAALEAQAVEDVHRRLDQAAEADALALETSSTAEALQHVTGQRRERQ